jgi:hypothetical protein
MAALVLVVMGACARGGDGGVKLSAGEPGATTSTTTCKKAIPSTTTTTTGGQGTQDTTYVTGLVPAGGFSPGTSDPGCPLTVAAGNWRQFDPGPLATRSEAVGVWTGREMVVVGGHVGYAAAADGAAYDPATGRWRMIAARPQPDHVVRLGVWTGKELVVFGVAGNSGPPASAAAYDPATDRWRSLAASPANLATSRFTPMMAAWTGRHVALYGIANGEQSKANVAKGGLYDPDADSWTVLPPLDGATAVGRATVAGDRLAVLSLSSGAGGPEPRLFLYDADRKEWHASPPAPVAIPSYPQVPPFWTGREVVVTSSRSNPSVGSIAYDPATDRWREVDAPPIADVAFGQRANQLADGRAIAQLDDPNGPLGIYDPGRDSWKGSGPPGTTSSSPVVVSTGDEVIFWGLVYEGGYVRPEQPSAAWIWTPAR